MNKPASPKPIHRSRDKQDEIVNNPRQLRQQAMADARKKLVLQAAKATFFELGMEKTSMREIAHRAGYSPGSIYSYFANKEELYAALLGESLHRLNERVEEAQKHNPSGADCLQATATAFFDFYWENPHDLDLGFYLYQGMKPQGLTPELNRSLNARLHDALQPTQEILQQMGMPAEHAQQEVTSLFAHIVGLLVLNHTGRIRMFKQAPQELFNTYLEQLTSRAESASRR